MKKTLLSGVKPSGDIHIGNYFGAMKQFVDLQDEYNTFIFIADYHALNQVHDAKILKENILQTAISYIAIGLDPEKCTLFKQSDVPEHTELCWIFNSITPLGLLKRAHAYKDAEEKNTAINMGLFDYPVLMAADILIYSPDVVPVGKDQKQHLEISQEIARIFNNTFGETFKIPSELILEEVAVIQGLDGRKMSKSYGNVLGLFDSREVLAKKIMSIVTDSKSPTEPKDPEADNIFYYHKILNPTEISSLATRYREGTISYKESKEMLLEATDKFIAPFRQKKEELEKDPAHVLEIIKHGNIKAREVASQTLRSAKEKIGVILD